MELYASQRPSRDRLGQRSWSCSSSTTCGLRSPDISRDRMADVPGGRFGELATSITTLVAADQAAGTPSLLMVSLGLPSIETSDRLVSSSNCLATSRRLLSGAHTSP